MTQINYIRNLYFNEGKTKAEISRITKLDIKTIQKYIEKQDFNLEISKPHNFGISILDPFKEIIDKWIEDDKIMRKNKDILLRKYTIDYATNIYTMVLIVL